MMRGWGLFRRWYELGVLDSSRTRKKKDELYSSQEPAAIL